MRTGLPAQFTHVALWEIHACLETLPKGTEVPGLQVMKLVQESLAIPGEITRGDGHGKGRCRCCEEAVLLHCFGLGKVTPQLLIFLVFTASKAKLNMCFFCA